MVPAHAADPVRSQFAARRHTNDGITCHGIHSAAAGGCSRNSENVIVEWQAVVHELSVESQDVTKIWSTADDEVSTCIGEVRDLPHLKTWSTANVEVETAILREAARAEKQQNESGR